MLVEKGKLDLSVEIRSLTEEMVTRLRDSFDALSKLERRLLDMLDNTSEIDPQFLLNVCRYFRWSANMEMNSIWDLATKTLNKKEKVSYSDNAEGNGKNNSGIIDVLRELPPLERERIRSSLT